MQVFSSPEACVLFGAFHPGVRQPLNVDPQEALESSHMC